MEAFLISPSVHSPGSRSPCSMPSTDSKGATQLFAVTLHTEACTLCPLCSEKSFKCAPRNLASARTPSAWIGNYLGDGPPPTAAITSFISINAR